MRHLDYKRPHPWWADPLKNWHDMHRISQSRRAIPVAPGNLVIVVPTKVSAVEVDIRALAQCLSGWPGSRSQRMLPILRKPRNDHLVFSTVQPFAPPLRDLRVQK